MINKSISSNTITTRRATIIIDFYANPFAVTSSDVTPAFTTYDLHASYWTKLESQLGQVVILSKPYYIHFISNTDVPDFEAYHKYSQVYSIISRQ